MDSRGAVLGVAAAVVLAFGAGGAVTALAGSDAAPDAAAHDHMHVSGEMRAMHAAMPADLQEECDEMHAGMAEHRGEAPMDHMTSGAGHMDGHHQGDAP